VVILDGDNLAVSERRRDGRVYFVLPGGGVEVGELLEAAAIREAFEELGVRVSLLGLVAQVTFVVDGIASRQHYFAAQITGGVFGTGPVPSTPVPIQVEAPTAPPGSASNTLRNPTCTRVRSCRLSWDEAWSPCSTIPWTSRSRARTRSRERRTARLIGRHPAGEP
jgi:ADP-ribose pyrophosphatase YjhB (NUDIX family)